MKFSKLIVLAATLVSFNSFAQSDRGDGPGNNSAQFDCSISIREVSILEHSEPGSVKNIGRDMNGFSTALKKFNIELTKDSRNLFDIKIGYGWYGRVNVSTGKTDARYELQAVSIQDNKYFSVVSGNTNFLNTFTLFEKRQENAQKKLAKKISKFLGCN